MVTTTGAFSSTSTVSSSKGITSSACSRKSFSSVSRARRIVHDPRLTWNTQDIVRTHGGVPVLCKSGHAFIKQKMREVDGAYGGEMSAHHYFRQFSYCDSGMIPWLLVLQVICERGQSLSQLVGERMRLFPASGEINRRLTGDPRAILARVRGLYESKAVAIDFTDGCRSNSRMALQSAQLEYGAARAPQCRVTGE